MPGIIDLMADENENDEDGFRFALRGNVFSELLFKGIFLSFSRAYGC
jgi:hypothetical protein